MNNSTNTFENDVQLFQNDSQLAQSFSQNSTTSLDITKLDLDEQVNSFAVVMHSVFNKIQEHKSNLEISKSDNESSCLKLCELLLAQHISALDKFNECIGERESLKNALNDANNEIQNLDRSLKFEKESKIDLKIKYEEYEQVNQEENLKRENLIKELQTKLKKIENEKKQLFDEKKELSLQYKLELAKYENERVQLQNMNKKLSDDKEIDELELLNLQNNLLNLTNEFCTLFNLASTNRRNPAFFGKQFFDAFDLVFGKVNLSSSNVTCLNMQSISEEMNNSTLNLKDLTCDEMNYFNMILEQNLVQNRDQTPFEESIRNSSKFNLSSNFENSYENRTYKLNSLHETTNNSLAIDRSTCFDETIAACILDNLIDEATKYFIIRTLISIRSRNSPTLQNSIYKNQIKYMSKPDQSMLDESFQEENYNRFEESFSENLARNLLDATGNGPEILKNILDNDCKDSEIDLRKIEEISQTTSSLANSTDNTNLKNESSINKQNSSEIQSIFKSKNWVNSTIYSRSSRTSNDTLNTTKDSMMVTLNPTIRSDGESQTESSSFCTESNADSDLNSMQMTNFNLSGVFNELSNDQKLNSTVKVNENNELKSIYSNKNDCPNSTVSSDMRLSEDDSKDTDDLNDLHDENNGTDPMLIDAMSKDGSLNNLHDFYSTIRQDSNHNITNMDLTCSSKTKSSSSSKSNQSFSLSKLIDKYDDENNLKKNSSECSLHKSGSNSKCRFRRRTANWSPYFSPILSLLYLFYPLFFILKCLFFMVVFFFFVAIYFLNHIPIIRIYYTSWEEIAMHMLRPN